LESVFVILVTSLSSQQDWAGEILGLLREGAKGEEGRAACGLFALNEKEASGLPTHVTYSCLLMS